MRTRLALLSLLVLSTAVAQTPPPGPFTESECLTCHNARDPELVERWRASPHADIGCHDCHGDRHPDSAAKARRDQNCETCHTGPARRSYATSKHGVITRLETRQHGWQRPLQRGDYRAPGCAYCHLHDGDHGDTMAPERGPEVRQWICAYCHSPRYVREQFAAGGRQMEITDLKLAEGRGLLDSATGLPSAKESELRQRLRHHRRNVLLGIGHQSPDYQWWHGQAALDGDLIRIRDLIRQHRPVPPRTQDQKE